MGVVTLPSGLQYKDSDRGAQEPKAHRGLIQSPATIVALFLTARRFDSSYKPRPSRDISGDRESLRAGPRLCNSCRWGSKVATLYSLGPGLWRSPGADPRSGIGPRGDAHFLKVESWVSRFKARTKQKLRQNSTAKLRGVCRGGQAGLLTQTAQDAPSVVTEASQSRRACTNGIIAEAGKNQ